MWKFLEWGKSQRGRKELFTKRNFPVFICVLMGRGPREAWDSEEY
jgi:hypothetical protein